QTRARRRESGAKISVEIELCETGGAGERLQDFTGQTCDPDDEGRGRHAGRNRRLRTQDFQEILPGLLS
ncbi:MAG TPA: hypothetical protein VLR69_10595, partial [Thermoanaerobaculia bacterium]|nr:hypothetical protein [Thermoanaerobaculia bacterium]